jgi:hypothetical protein
MFKKFLSAFLSLTLLLSIFAINPSITNASSFAIDSKLNVSPANDTINFGEVSLNNSEIEDFTISNNGPFPRHIQIISGPTQPFSLVGSPSFSLNPYSSRKLSFQFQPRTENDFEQDFTIKEIYTNEAKTLTLVGTGTEASITRSISGSTKVSYTNNDVIFSPEDDETLSFEDTVEDYSSEKTIYVVNNTDDRATVRVTERPSGAFELSSGRSATLSEDEVEYFTIKFTPQSDREYSDTIEFEIKGEDEDGDDFEEEVTIRLNGEGIELDDEDDPFEFNFASEEINPEAGEKAYFNFYADITTELDIEIFDDGETIYEQSYTVTRGKQDLDYFWAGL